MRPASSPASDQPYEASAPRPPNYLLRSIIVAIFLLPLALLFGLSSLVGFLAILTGPPVISEIPWGMRALMQALRALAACGGIIAPLGAIINGLKVNSRFAAGDRAGAAAAAKTARSHSLTSIILLVLLTLMMGVDVLEYMTSTRR